LTIHIVVMASLHDNDWVVVEGEVDTDNIDNRNALSTWTLIASESSSPDIVEEVSTIEARLTSPLTVNCGANYSSDEEAVSEEESHDRSSASIPANTSPHASYGDVITETTVPVDLRTEDVADAPGMEVVASQQGTRVGQTLGMMLLYWALTSAAVSALIRRPIATSVPQIVTRDVQRNPPNVETSRSGVKLNQPRPKHPRVTTPEVAREFHFLQIAEPVSQSMVDQYRRELATLYGQIKKSKSDSWVTQLQTLQPRLKRPNSNLTGEQTGLRRCDRNTTTLSQQQAFLAVVSAEPVLKLHSDPRCLINLTHAKNRRFHSLKLNGRRNRWFSGVPFQKRTGFEPYLVRRIARKNNSKDRLKQSLVIEIENKNERNASESRAHSLSRALIHAPSTAVGRHFHSCKWVVCVYDFQRRRESDQETSDREKDMMSSALTLGHRTDVSIYRSAILL